MNKGRLARVYRCSYGFSTVLFLAALPLFLSLFFFAAQVFQLLHLHTRTHFRCRATLLKGQEQLSELLRRLLLLNSRAKLLQSMEAAATRAVQGALLSGNPALIATAKAQLEYVHAQQGAFAFVQNTILSEARAIAMNLPIRFWSASELRGAHRQGQKLASPSGLAVEPVPPTSRSPVYKPVPSFERAQAMAFRWTVPVEVLVPKFLTGSLPINNVLNGTCAATLKMEKHQWTAELTRVKL